MSLLHNYVQFNRIPYARVVYDNTQDFRNLSVLSTLLQLNPEQFTPWYYTFHNKISRQEWHQYTLSQKMNL